MNDSWRIDSTIRSTACSARARGILVMTPTIPGMVSLEGSDSIAGFRPEHDYAPTCSGIVYAFDDLEGGIDYRKHFRRPAQHRLRTHPCQVTHASRQCEYARRPLR